MTLYELHNECALKNDSLTFTVTVYDSHSGLVSPHSALCSFTTMTVCGHHNDFLWFLFTRTRTLCVLTMTLCDLHNKSVCDHNDIVMLIMTYLLCSQWFLCALTMTLWGFVMFICVLTMTLWDILKYSICCSQWILVIIIKTLDAFTMAVKWTMPMCEMNNDSLWSSQWLCVPS